MELSTVEKTIHEIIVKVLLKMFCKQLSSCIEIEYTQHNVNVLESWTMISISKRRVNNRDKLSGYSRSVFAFNALTKVQFILNLLRQLFSVSGGQQPTSRASTWLKEHKLLIESCVYIMLCPQGFEIKKNNSKHYRETSLCIDRL